MTLEEKRDFVKNELGIKQAVNMKEDTLDAKIAEAQEIQIEINSSGKKMLDFFGIKSSLLKDIGKASGFSKLEYSALRKSFKCYKLDKMVGWLSMEQITQAGK